MKDSRKVAAGPAIYIVYKEVLGIFLRSLKYVVAGSLKPKARQGAGEQEEEEVGKGGDVITHLPRAASTVSVWHRKVAK